MGKMRDPPLDAKSWLPKPHSSWVSQHWISKSIRSF